MKEDRIISALIGLTGACSTNPKTDNTDNIIIKALAFPLICPEYDDRELQEIINDIYSEKNSVAPGCAVCKTPCGNTSDYDMSRIYKADSGARDAKLRVLDVLKELAVYIYRCQKSGMTSYADNDFFYKALSYVSYDMDEPALLGLLDEAENLEHNIRSGGIQNGQKDY